MEIEAVKVHDLVPSSYEIVHELCLRVGCPVDLGESTKLRIGPEDEIDTGAVPFEIAGFSVATLEDFSVFCDGFPFRAHVKEVEKVVVGK